MRNDVYFVGENEETKEFLVVNPQTNAVEFTTNEQDADWDENVNVVRDYIDLLQIPPGVRVKPKQGTGLNHPPKPPISAM